MREDDLWRRWMKLPGSESSVYQRLETVMITIPNSEGAG